MEKIITHLQSFTKLSQLARQTIQQQLQKEVFPKHHIILNQGSICRRLYFVEKGLLRGFYYLKKKEVTSWFAGENDFVTSMAAFINQKPSNENIETLETCTLYSISYEELQSFYVQFPEFNLIGRLIIEKYYTELEERTLSLQYQSAQERYQQLMHQFPHLLQRTTLGHIASFLGISQETLSRIRAKV